MPHLFPGLEPATGSRLINFAIDVIVLWVAQRIILPRKKDRGVLSIIAMVLAGTVVLFFLRLIPVIGTLVAFFGFLFFIRAWFDIEWPRALGIAGIAYILYLAVTLITGHEMPRWIAHRFSGHPC